MAIIRDAAITAKGMGKLLMKIPMLESVNVCAFQAQEHVAELIALLRSGVYLRNLNHVHLPECKDIDPGTLGRLVTYVPNLKTSLSICGKLEKSGRLINMHMRWLKMREKSTKLINIPNRWLKQALPKVTQVDKVR